MTGIKKQLVITMGYLGAVIGAGFASGQEIVQFFVCYGKWGAAGAVLATVLFAVCGGMLLSMAHRQKIANYQAMLSIMFGPRLGKIVDFLLAIFLFLGLSTMLSASGAVFYEHLYLPKYAGILLAYVAVVIALAAGKKSLIFSYNVLVPVKIMLLLIISGYIALFAGEGQCSVYTSYLIPRGENAWLLSSLLYVAYNFSLAMVVLTAYQSVSNRREGIGGAVLGGLVLGLLVLLNYAALSKYLPAVIHYQVPMLYIAGQVSPLAKSVYTLVLWIGILTTAIANAYGFAQRFARFTGIDYAVCLIVCMTLALPIATQSFSSLVNRVYPLFGLLGLLILSGLVYHFLRSRAGN
ncbi:MAG TPA: hypothetical protein PLC88_03975 [Syntrophomonas sp.]|nr:hypothetical protein [Syntrophomonas sp.]